MTVWSNLKQVRPRSWSKGRPAGKPRIIFVHYTAGAENPVAAENGAAYDTRRTDGTSAHYYVDSNSIVQCLDTAHRSHTALYNANLVGIHYELCGTRQTRAQWLDAASRATIRLAARQIARDMKDNGIPLKRLVGRQVRSGKGIAGHHDATIGWPEDGGSHTDPGTAFPWDVLLADIKSFMAPAPAPAPAPKPSVASEKGDMTKYPTYAKWYGRWGGVIQSMINWFTKGRPAERANQARRDAGQDALIKTVRTDLAAVKVELAAIKAELGGGAPAPSPTPDPVPQPSPTLPPGGTA